MVSKAALERRRHKRAPLHLLMQLRIDDEATFRQEYSSNISVGGMFIRTDTPSPLGSIVDFRFCVDAEKNVVAGVGRVVFVRYPPYNPMRDHLHEPAGMGIEFDELSEESALWINKLVDERLQRAVQDLPEADSNDVQEMPPESLTLVPELVGNPFAVG